MHFVILHIAPGKTDIDLMKLAAVLIFGLGWFIRYRIKRRAFYRRNAAGLEEFSSYEKATFTDIIEGFGKFTAIFFIIIGIIFFAFLWWLGNQK